MLWPLWLACASIAVPACERTWFFVKVVISDAMSRSRIVDSAALKFCIVVFTFCVATSMRLWSEPMAPSATLTLPIATSISESAVCARASVVGSVFVVRVETWRSSCEPVMAIVSFPLY